MSGFGKRQFNFPDEVRKIIEKRTVTAEDVLVLRRGVFADHAVSRDEADALFAIEWVADQASPEWRSFFEETLVDLMVKQVNPQGYILPEDAEWLMERLAIDGQIHHTGALDALITVIDKAVSCPPELSAFALEQVKTAVLTGQGAGRDRGLYLAGVVTEDDVERMRRILYSFGGDGHVGITRAEAEILFDINDETVHADNHPSWTDLFVKAIASTVMSLSGYQAPCRQEALRRAQWLDDTSVNTGNFFGRMVSGGLSAIIEAYKKPEPFTGNEEATEAERVTAQEAQWLADRLSRDGVIHETEKALLTFLMEESHDVHPALQTVMDAVA